MAHVNARIIILTSFLEFGFLAHIVQIRFVTDVRANFNANSLVTIFVLDTIEATTDS